MGPNTDCSGQDQKQICASASVAARSRAWERLLRLPRRLARSVDLTIPLHGVIIPLPRRPEAAVAARFAHTPRPRSPAPTSRRLDRTEGIVWNIRGRETAGVRADSNGAGDETGTRPRHRRAFRYPRNPAGTDPPLNASSGLHPCVGRRPPLSCSAAKATHTPAPLTAAGCGSARRRPSRVAAGRQE